MRKSIFITLGVTLLLWFGQAQARPSFVSEELESDATRLEQNIGEDLGHSPHARSRNCARIWRKRRPAGISNPQ